MDARTVESHCSCFVPTLFATWLPNHLDKSPLRPHSQGMRSPAETANVAVTGLALG